MEKIIETSGLEFYYGKQKIINNLSLEVPKNAIYGFLGPNGAGKSTTIKLLLGLIYSNKDNIKIFGKNIKDHRKEILSRTGNLIESPTIYENLTAAENLKYLEIIYKKGKRRIDEVLHIIGMSEHRNKRAKHFSMGMKQRLGIGMAIYHDPELVILDEPVNGLDPKGVFEVRELLLNLQNLGKTILISSHLLSEIEKTCSHVGIIKKGEVLFQGVMNELTCQTSKSVEIQTNNNRAAAVQLKKAGFSIIEKSDSLLDIKISNQYEFNNLLSSLITNNIEIYNVEKKSSNLEDIFINLTSN